MSASMPPPCLALRGSEGIWMVLGPPENKRKVDFRDTNKNCRCMEFSSDGRLFAYNNCRTVVVVNLLNNAILCQLERPKTMFIKFSPKGTYIATWEAYFTDKNTPQGQQGAPNMNIWEVESGKLVKGFIRKSHENWCPIWTEDEHICARNISNEVHFYVDGKFDTFETKLRIEKLAEFSITRTGPPYSVASYVPGSKGQPSFVRVFKYPEFTGAHAVVANKSFYKSDKVSIHWNYQGTAVLILTSTESSIDSYYGDQGLHFMSTGGDSSIVPLGKNGPVYHLEWNPNSPEFCVVYGFMPAKATMYNMKCEPIFDFGTGPRNFAYFNPFGNILCLAGFGNLQGVMEFWDVKKKKQISSVKAADSTFFEWCPNGEYFVTATTSPRLRVDNGYKVWHYTGSVVNDEKCVSSQELWQAMWRPVSKGTYSAHPIRYKPLDTADAPKPEAKVAAYRPPGARGTQSSFKLNEYESPSNADAGNQNLSKAALRNKKKKENRKLRQDNTDQPKTESKPSLSVIPPSTGDVEKDKRIRALNKKIDAIKKLKDQQKEGKKMELNQLEKIKCEDKLLSEMEELMIDS